MYIRIDPTRVPPAVDLADEHNFRAFAIVVNGDRGALPAVIDALTEIGTVTADGAHAFLNPDGVRALAGGADQDWRAGFDQMIDYARAKGWADDAGRVRAHLEWRAPAAGY